MNTEIITRSTVETESIGAEFAQNLKAGDFVAMFGDLGAGKTAFVRGAMKTLSASARVQSPTYTIVNEYPAKIPVYHFDMYRIEGEDDLYSIGFYDYLDGKNLCITEWSENIEDCLPDRYIRVEIIKNDPSSPDSREIRISEVK